MTSNRSYPWTQADRTPEIDQLAQDAGEAQADREALAAERAGAWFSGYTPDEAEHQRWLDAVEDAEYARLGNRYL